MYESPERQHQFVMSRVIAGAPGSGKSYILSYAVLYALQKGLRVGMTAIMTKRTNVLGGIHMHNLFINIVKRNKWMYKIE